MKVSVLVPVYNGGKFLAECLESVLSQDFSDFELLVSDNASTDSTPEVIARFAQKDSRIVSWRNAENIGFQKNFQLCLQRARGEHIKFLCADDKLLVPSALRKMSALLSENRSVSLVSSAAQLIDPQSKLIRTRKPLPADQVMAGKRAIVYCWERNGNIIGEPSGVMFRRAQGGHWFHGRCAHLLDLEQWFALLEQGDWAYISEPLFAFRQHPEQGTNTNRKTGLGEKDALVLMTACWQKPWLREMATNRMLFTQIYYLEKYFGEESHPLTFEMRTDLGTHRYAVRWLAHKIQNPLKIVRRLNRGALASPSMKVLMIAEEHGVPPETQIGLLLARAGVEVRFIFRTGSVSAKFLREQGMNVQELPIRGRLDVNTLRAIRAVVKEFQPDVIHAFTAKACWYAILAQRFLKKAKLVFYRGAMRPFSRFSPADLLVFYGQGVDMFECYSIAVQKDLVSRGISAERTFVNYYGHKPEWYAGGTVPPQWAEKKARFRIGCVANHRKVKGLEFLVAASDLLAKKDLDFELLLVGKDGNGELAKCVSHATSRDRIKLTGPISEPWGIMKTFDCLVVPSLQEAMGRVTLEAMACGVPLVVTDVGGLPEVVEDGKNGLVVPSKDPVQLAAAIAQLLGDESLRKKFGESGRQVLREKFDLDQTRDRLLALYQRLAK